MIAHQIQPRPISRVKPARDAKYLKWLRSQPCACCGKRKNVEAAHTGNRGAGMGLKADDRDAIPLCEGCHRNDLYAYHKIGNETTWELLHGLNLPKIRQRVYGEYQRRNAA